MNGQPDLGQVWAQSLQTLAAAFTQQQQLIMQQRRFQAEMAENERLMTLREKNLKLEADALKLRNEQFEADKALNEQKMKLAQETEQRKGEYTKVMGRAREAQISEGKARTKLGQDRLAFDKWRAANQTKAATIKDTLAKIDAQTALEPIEIEIGMNKSLSEIVSERRALQKQISVFQGSFAAATPESQQAITDYKALLEAEEVRRAQHARLQRAALGGADDETKRMFQLAIDTQLGGDVTDNTPAQSPGEANAPRNPGLDAAVAPTGGVGAQGNAEKSAAVGNTSFDPSPENIERIKANLDATIQSGGAENVKLLQAGLKANLPPDVYNKLITEMKAKYGQRAAR